MKLVKLWGVSVVVVLLFSVGVAQAQFTLLPNVEMTIDECNQILNEFDVVGSFQEMADNELQAAFDSAEKDLMSAESKKDDSYELLQLAQVAVDDSRKAWQSCFNSGSNANCDSQYAAYQSALEAKQKAMNNNSEAVKAYDKAKTDNANVYSQLGGDSAQTDDSQFREMVLGCAIKTGRISLTMIPYFIKYIADFLLGLSGLVAVLFIVVGGYFYVWGGITDNKEKGKKTVINALIGLAVAILSWAIVSMVISVLTS